jgi:hypothetical protein
MLKQAVILISLPLPVMPSGWSTAEPGGMTPLSHDFDRGVHTTLTCVRVNKLSNNALYHGISTHHGLHLFYCRRDYEEAIRPPLS